MKRFLVVLTLIRVALAAPEVSEPTPFRTFYGKSIKPVETKIGPHILGGQEATPHSLPYQAFLEITNRTSVWQCSGVLISANYILTSGACCDRGLQAHIILGAHNINEEDDSQIVMISTELTVHEDFDADNIINNIAFVRLPSSIRFSPKIQPIFLPSEDDISNSYLGALCTTSGWGVTNSATDALSNVLNFLQVVVISNSECSSAYGSDIDSSSLCTSGNENIGVCTADVGGPLVTDGVLIGITSFHATDCGIGLPSGFTRVTSFISWIIENTDAQITKTKLF